MKEENIYHTSFSKHKSDAPSGWTAFHIINNGIGGFERFERFDEIHSEIREWIYYNIDLPEENAIWYRVNDCIYVQLRRSQDATLFALRWL